MYTLFKTDFAQSQAQHRAYQRTPLEWELLGDLALRLDHTDDALECYRFYAESRYTFRVWFKLLRLYEREGKSNMALTACEMLLCVLDRWRCGESAVGVLALV